MRFATAPFMLKTADNLEGGVDEGALDGMLASLRRDRVQWAAAIAYPWFGNGLPGVSVSTELMDWGVGLFVKASPLVAIDLSRAGFVIDNPSPGRCPILRAQGNLYTDIRALPGDAFYPERTAQTRGALAHRFEAEVTREIPPRIEAGAVVRDFQGDAARVVLELQICPACAGVLDGVVQGLLGYAVECLLGFQGQLGLLAQRSVHRELVTGLERRRLLF